MAVTKEQLKELRKLMNELGKGRQYLDQYGLFSDEPFYNPDDLVGRKGLTVFDDMTRKDGQVKSCLFFKKFARLSTGWNVQAASNDPMDIQVRDFISYCFENMEGTLNQTLLDVMKAFDRGYSVVEIVLDPIEEGEWKGKWGVKRLKSKRQKDIYFDTDDFGNLHPQRGLQQLVNGEYVMLPAHKFIIYSHNKVDDNWYGESDLRAAYRYWFLKDMIERFWAVYLEQFGSPAVGASYAPGTPISVVKEILSTMKTLAQGKRFAHPSDWKVEMHEASGSSTTAYEQATTYFNKMISRAILVPSLLQDEGASHGSYALSKSHVNSFIWVLKHDGEKIADAVNEHLIRKLARLNFPVTSYPTWGFNEFKDEDIKNIADTLIALAGAGMKISHKYVHDRLGIPEPEEGEEVLTGKAATQPPDESTLGDAETEPPPLPEEEQKEKMEFVEKTLELSREPDQLESKVDLFQVDAQESSEMDSTAGRIGIVLEAMRDGLIAQVKKKSRPVEPTTKH